MTNMFARQIVTGGVIVLVLLVSAWFVIPREAPAQPVDIASLPAAHANEIVDLSDGDRYEMTAAYVRKTIGNKEYAMLAYNGSIPGPLLRVPQGATVTLKLTNATDIETMLHAHGLRLENSSDGTHLTQAAIPPGGAFTYTLSFPDAGIYWYHPHVREDLAQDLGLYGNSLVMPAQTDYWSPVNREVPLIFDDLLVDDSGAIVPHGTQEANFALMGRYGNVMLVNGETRYSLDAQPGEVIRFYLTNAANARPFRIAIPGVRMKLVGADGGAYEKETWQDAVTIGPSERAVIEVLFADAGRYTLEHQTPEANTVLGIVEVRGNAASPSYADVFSQVREHLAVQQEIDALRPYFREPINKTLRLAVDMNDQLNTMMQSGSHRMQSGSMMHGGMMMGETADGIEWEDTSGTMNATSTSSMVDWQMIDEETGNTNEDVHWRFTVGDKVKIRITNDETSAHPMQHPIHFHGQRFLVISRNGIEEDNLVWKDTVMVPAGESVDILLDVTNPGEWMAHCHIAEHLEAGMMTRFTVQE